MTNKEIDEAMDLIDEIATLLYYGLIRNVPNGSNDKERIRRYNTIGVSADALEIIYNRLSSIRKDHTLYIIDKDS